MVIFGLFINFQLNRWVLEIPNPHIIYDKSRSVVVTRLRVFAEIQHQCLERLQVKNRSASAKFECQCGTLSCAVALTTSTTMLRSEIRCHLIVVILVLVINYKQRYKKCPKVKYLRAFFLKFYPLDKDYQFKILWKS